MSGAGSTLPRVVSRKFTSTQQSLRLDVGLKRTFPLQSRNFRSSHQWRKEEKLSFRGQLYESTAQRLARERADESRFAAARNTPNNTLRLFATTFGMYSFYLN